MFDKRFRWTKKVSQNALTHGSTQPTNDVAYVTLLKFSTYSSLMQQPHLTNYAEFSKIYVVNFKIALDESTLWSLKCGRDK